jgi:type III secretion system YscQ/HrcQ family protein
MAMAAQSELLPMASADVAMTLETIDPAVLPVVQGILQRRGPCLLRIQGHEVRFAWADVQLREHAMSMTLICGAHDLLIELDSLATIDPLLIGEPFQLLPPSLRSLVVQRALASLLSTAPRALGESTQVGEVRWATPPSEREWPVRLGFCLERGQNGCISRGVILARSAAGLAWFDQQLPTQPTRSQADIQSLPIPIRIALGRSNLKTAALRNLSLGDVVWVQSARLTRVGVDVDCRIARHSFALATARHRQLQIKQIHGLAMKQQPPATDVPAAPASVAIDSARTLPSRNLEVPVTFDLGELPLPLTQIERLQPGALLQLPQDVSDATIQVRVGDSLVAQGALVAIGKRIGVRITRVYLEESAPNPAVT